MINTADQLSRTMSPEAVMESYKGCSAVYRKARAADKFQVKLDLPDRSDAEILGDWIGWTALSN
jgi:hypothetical protein